MAPVHLLRYRQPMDIFEQAKASADQIAPPPADKPVAAAAVSVGFGLFVIGLYFALHWLGFADWMAWVGSAFAYGAIAYADCTLAWRRNTREFHAALAELKSDTGTGLMH